MLDDVAARQSTAPPAGSRRSQASPFGRLILVTGPEALLADRVVEEVLDAVRAEEPEVEVTLSDAPRLDGNTLADITGGSLFATRRAAVIRDLANLPADLHDMVVTLGADPYEDVAVVLVHGGGSKGKGVLDKLKKTGVEVVDCPAVKTWDLPQFVKAEVQRANARIEPDAVGVLIDSVGHDLRSLVAAVSQLLVDGEGQEVTAALVRRYFAGRSEVTSFAVADAALAGRTGVAMEQLRWALSTGVAPVLVTSALASGLRGLGKLIGAPGGGRDADLARDVGVPPWKLKSMRAQLRGWDQPGLAHAIGVVAAADADIKGAADDASYALERAILAVSRSRVGR